MSTRPYRLLFSLLSLFALAACSHDDELDALADKRKPAVVLPDPCTVVFETPTELASIATSSDSDPALPGVQTPLVVRVSGTCQQTVLSYGVCTRDATGNAQPPTPWQGTLTAGRADTYRMTVTLADTAGTQYPCVGLDSTAAVSVTRTCDASEQLCSSDQRCHADTKTNAKFCGASCQACEGGANGQPSCVAGACELSCDEGFRFEAGRCRRRPSCVGAEAACKGQDCCAQDLISEGAGQPLRLIRGYDKSENASGLSSFQPASSPPATLDEFYMDRFEVTVGRFRRFADEFERWRGGANPKSQQGEHPKIGGSGWQPVWEQQTIEQQGGGTRNAVPRTRAELVQLVTSPECGSVTTWSETPGARDSAPINCVNFFAAYMFCIWDSETSYSRLPSETEWHVASSGGGEQRAYPWSVPAANLAAEGFALYGQNDLLPDPVGSYPTGKGRWNTLDLGGSVFEWTRDTGNGAPIDPTTGAYATSYNPYGDDRDNPLSLANDGDIRQTHVLKGGSFKLPNCLCDPQIKLRSVSRTLLQPAQVFNDVGFRCVRNYP